MSSSSTHKSANKWIGLAAAVGLIVAVALMLPPLPESAPSSPAAQSTDAGSSESVGASGEADTKAGCVPGASTGSGAHRAAVWVSFGDGARQVACVAFDEPSLTGFELLERAGLDIAAKDFGPALGQALCRLSGVAGAAGCDYPNESCFCSDSGGTWVLFQESSGTGSWTRSETGASQSVVKGGSGLALLWGTEDVAPPACSAAEICSGERSEAGD